MEAGFDSDIGGDVPDWDNTESRESDEDAAWRDLVARFEEPTTTTGPAPGLTARTCQVRARMQPRDRMELTGRQEFTGLTGRKRPKVR